MRELYRDIDIISDIKKKTMDCFGRVIRMDQGRTVTKIFERKPEGIEEMKDLD